MSFWTLLKAAVIGTLLLSAMTLWDTGRHYVELFSHFHLQYLAVAGVLMIVFAVRRSHLYAVAALVAVAINASFLVPWYGTAQAAPGGTALKFVYANLLSTNDNFDRLLALIEAEQPDLIFLQEFSPQWHTATKPLHASYPVRYVQPREDNFGIAMFSRVPLASVSHVDSPPLGYPTLIATASVNGAELTLVSSHPMNPVGRNNFAARNEQLASLAELVSAIEGPIMLLGDLNATIWDRYYRQFEVDTGLRNARRGFGILPTWPTFMPIGMIPIDHVLISEEISVVEARTGPRIGSDHLPLIVTVTGNF
ncbi:MAG: endonuclease/exonuclease/phosphatase family protein [Gammaproteobacteria bacterium]|nr:endonuclease/exonuclease/phosphatase family protein [Gammaproteobacteria bacterium]